MKLHTLTPKAGATKKKMRVGRGNGSGKGTYSTRGCKGQGQRKSGNVRPGFEGGQTPLIMRLPKLKGFTSPNPLKFQVVNVSKLNAFNDNDEVNMITLLEKGIISKATVPVKVLGTGQLEKKLTLNVHQISKSAKQKVLEAGGKIL